MEKQTAKEPNKKAELKQAKRKRMKFHLGGPGSSRATMFIGELTQYEKSLEKNNHPYKNLVSAQHEVLLLDIIIPISRARFIPSICYYTSEHKHKTHMKANRQDNSLV